MLLLARLEDGINLAHASGNAEQSLKHGARDREEPPMPDLADLFPGYEAKWINTSQGRIFARVGGKGPPLLLLHGFSSKIGRAHV